MNVRHVYLSLACCIFIGMASGCSPYRKVARYDYLANKPSIAPEPERPAPSPRPAPRTRPAAEEPAESPLIISDLSDTPSTPAPPKKKRRNRTKAIGSLDSRDVAEVIQSAKQYTGVPYVYGGMSRKGMDCSGLMCLAFKEIDITLPRTSREMAAKGKKISKSEIRPGALVFFNTKGPGVSHVGLVVEGTGANATFLHASSSRGVTTDELSDPYWKGKFIKAVTY
ncbi:C40 family peptidase [Pontibacter sp. G13]|uniref:C40 family peptidase n=1 Tax=Pontibacter sp. G13 TaxID=3074898 RepID=UPI0028899114|nr:C40 family peptidase [Pontibacter sp. G13]WNJ20974.1 C40 family peptidase [Pontibacter sp. G13]